MHSARLFKLVSNLSLGSSLTPTVNISRTFEPFGALQRSLTKDFSTVRKSYLPESVSRTKVSKFSSVSSYALRNSSGEGIISVCLTQRPYSSASSSAGGSESQPPKTNFLRGLSKVEGTSPETIEAAAKNEKNSEESAKSPETEEEQKKREEEAKKSMRTLKISFAVLGVLFSGWAGYIVAIWGSPERDQNGQIKEDQFSNMALPLQYFARAWHSVGSYAQSIKDPSSDKLLPDPLKDPYYQPPYTVVLELTGILVHPDWTYQTGWRFKKRPGIDFFLSQTGPPIYEIVIYTAENAFTAYPITEALDPKGYIMYRLFRDSTKYVEGTHMKDLDSLNRDLSKVIVVDWNEKALANHPRNLLRLKKWKGEDTDRSLFDLALLLRAIAQSEVSDVREVLDYYRQFEDPLEAFRENQRKLQEAEEERLRALQEEKPRWTPSIFGRRFG